MPSTSSQAGASEHSGISRALYNSLPSQHDADIVISAGNTASFLQFFTLPYTDLYTGNMRLASDLSALPSPINHPVLLARTLLYLAHGLQNLDPSTFHINQLSIDLTIGEAMKRYLDTASRLVTSNDELIESLEGLECLVLEAVFHLNAGNLRRAWLLFKRAIGLAQLVGLDSGNIVNLMVLDPNSIVSPAIMWYRIVGQDRYLALVLGLPAGTAEDSFVPLAAQVPDDCPTGRLERQHCVLMDRMASQHNQKDEDPEIICSIDKGFQEAAQSVPPEWWLLPRTRHGERSSGIDSGSNLEDMMRILVQITHYNLLLLLHLPSILRARGKGVQDYSRDTCVNSSRELLNRYIRLRCMKRAPFCCRMIDFCAFTGCLTLLLSHINRLSHREPGTSDVLAHHHLSDRATVEETVELMLEFNQTNNDV